MQSRGHGTRLALLLLLAAACGAPDPGQRQADVAAAGADVMPFDLDATTHVFEKLADGGLQTVVADTDDPEQIALVRSHLSFEAERFSAGDFHDPAAIHGDDMAGLHALVMGHERVAVTYREVPRGGEIRYASSDPALVAALHQWFDQQVDDHGEHAQAHH